MKVHKYKNYDEYKKIQTAANKKKINFVYADSNALGNILVPFITDNVPSVKFGLCHGTRNGAEQKAFKEGFEKKGLNVDVLGTEISDTAKGFPDTIEWDFHEVKAEWIGSVDFIYSNALDHSYKPEDCLQAWMSCLKKDGVCILEWTSGHQNSRPMDPFGATLDEYKQMAGRYMLDSVVRNDVSKDSGKDFKGERYFLIIKNR